MDSIGVNVRMTNNGKHVKECMVSGTSIGVNVMMTNDEKHVKEAIISNTPYSSHRKRTSSPPSFLLV